MKQQLSFSTALRDLATATASAAVVCGAAAQSGAVSNVTVAVHASHYALDGRVFEHVDDLGAAIDAMRRGPVGIDACGPGTTRALMVAVYRLRDRPLHLRVHEGDAVACSKQAPVALQVVQRGLRVDDEAVDRYWHSIAP